MQLFNETAGPDNQNLWRLAQDLDLSPDEAAAVVEEVLPEIRRNLERRTLSRGGLAELVKALGRMKEENYLDPTTDLSSDTATASGNSLLDQILETKYRSRRLADQAEAKTGVPAAKIRRLLPRIANLSMSALSQQARPGLEEIFKKLPDIQGKASARSSPQADSPLPLPDDNWGGSSNQDHSRYNDLSDVLTRRQRPLQSNPLWDMVRKTIGGAFGFQSKGIVGYIIRFVIYRYGMTILRMLFSRIFRA